MKPYGCHNSERKPGYFTPQRSFLPNGCFVISAMWVKDITSKDCQYRKETPNDPLCKGCMK